METTMHDKPVALVTGANKGIARAGEPGVPFEERMKSNLAR
jgi:hypothetical protein